jgi:penicillin amidase
MSMLNSLLGPILKLGLTWLSRRRLPQIDGTLTLPGLNDPVEVIRDRWGVPHIYAKSSHDLFFAQGFVHAQDRLFQMEIHRRLATGKLSELFGELSLDTDRTVRTFGFQRLGKADGELISQEMQDILQFYTDGVNAFLRHPGTKLPVEFTLLGHKPEPWHLDDSTAFARVMIWQLSHAWYSEIVRAQIAEKVGVEHAAELEIHYPDLNPTILPQGIEFNKLGSDGQLVKAQGPFLERGLGSNAWSVAGHKTASGDAYLCNDMHLPVSTPALWYENHLVGDRFNVTGVSLPGLPLVMVGHNERITWGMTLAFTDCEDLFIEKFDPQDPHRYQFRDEWLEAEVVEEFIPVKGRAESHVEQVLITQHGPIISDVVGYPEQRVAVNSMALQPCPILDGWLLLNKASGWDEFVGAMRQIEAPQLGTAYGDVEGNVGYWATGKVPIRAKGDGSVPVPGWTGEYEWVGEVPFEEMPHALNPERGYIVTCNHRIVSDDYPHFLGNVWMNGYRARRIEDVFEDKEKLFPEDFQALHVDTTCIPGMELVAQLEGFTSEDPDVQIALQRLRSWNGQLTTDTVGGTIYEVARYRMVRNLLEPGLGQELAFRVMGQGFHPLLKSSCEFLGHDTTTLIRLLKDSDSWWVKQAGGREALISKCLKEAVEWLRTELGPNPEGWQWGKIHRVILAHTLGLQKPLDQVFNRGPVPIGGDTDTPCATALLANEPYDNKTWSPSFRQIVDLGDLSQSVVIIPPGQSGHLGSVHYDDLLEPWAKGEYHPMLWKREEIEREAEGKLILKSP